jgi:hypothetical protein
VLRSSNIRVRGSLRLITLCAVLFLAPVLVAATPEWVRQAAAQSLPAYDAETNAAVLLDEGSVTVTGATEYLEHYRRVVRILRPEGRAEANLHVNLEAHEKVDSIHCWALDRSGKEFELKDKDFAERGVVSGYELYDDARARTGTCPAANPGSVIAFEYEVQRHVSVNEYEWEFQESIPVHESRLVIYLPAGWEYRTLWANGSPIEPSRRGDRGLEWTLRDLPAIDHEPMGLQPFALCRRLGVVYFPPQTTANAGSWEAIGRWYAQLTVDRRNSTPELAERARQLTAGMADFDSKARSIASFLQSDIRYVAIEIGIGGEQPHRAGDVFRARYGDCKDKATLLSTMLHEVSIESGYVLVDTHRGIIVPTLPSPRSNHAILAIELPEQIKTDTYRSVVVTKSGKRYLIFDPTDPYTPLGELRGELQDTYALLVADGRGELIHTPLSAPDANLMARKGRFTLSAEGSLAGEMVENWSGSHAWHERVYLMRDNEQERSQRLEHRVSRSLKGFTLENFDIKQLDQLQQDLVTSFRFANPGYAQVRGSLMLVRPRVMGEKTLALDRKPRHFPFQFEATSRETDVYEFELPKEYVVDDVPEPVNVDMGFGAYHSKIEVDGRSLRYSREFLRRDVLIPPDRAEDLRKLQSIIGADENAAVVLRRVQ